MQEKQAERARKIAQLELLIADARERGADADVDEYTKLLYDEEQARIQDAIAIEQLNQKIANIDIDKLQKFIDYLRAMSDYLQSIISTKNAEGKYATPEMYEDVSSKLFEVAAKQKEQGDLMLANAEKAQAAENGVYGGMSYNEWMQEYYNTMRGSNESLSAAFNTAREGNELELTKMTAQLNNLKSSLEVFNSSLDLKEAIGHYLTAEDYMEQIGRTNTEIAKQEMITKENQRLYNEALAKGNTLDAERYFDAMMESESATN